jgi:Cytochrome c554 and c-prime
MKRSWVIMFVLGLGIIGCAILLLAQRGSAPDASTTPTIDLPKPTTATLPTTLQGEGVLIAWASHANARFEPCGCVAGMHGGLMRRATVMQDYPREQRLYVEVGGWSGGTAPYERLRTTYYAQGLIEQLDGILGIGAAETRMGSPFIKEIHQRYPQHLVSANVTDASGQLLVTPMIRRTIAGKKLCITSVAPVSAKNAEIHVNDPVHALVALTGQLQGAALVVLADMNEQDLQELARAVPEMSVLIGGQVAQPTQNIIRVGQTHIMAVANEGKTLGAWRWGKPQPYFTLLVDTIPSDEPVKNYLRQYQERLGQMDLAPDERLAGMTTLASANGARYVGDDNCRICHAQTFEIHNKSRHAHALASLEKKGYRFDPDCLRCHVTGLDQSDGFSRRGTDPGNMRFAQVSCENCHGRGSIHVAERIAQQPSSGSLTTISPASCVRCHDAENSPSFNYKTYWERIRHGLQ